MSAPRLPETIEVGPNVYDVRPDELERLRLEHAEQKSLAGHTDHNHLYILIDATIAPAQVRDTVLHETLHTLAFLSGLGFEWGTQREEEIVRRLSPLLLDVLRRNPALVAYLCAP